VGDSGHAQAQTDRNGLPGRFDPGATALGPLLYAVLVPCKPDWWTLTGWERVDATVIAPGRALQQSWILQPLDRERG